MATHFLSRSLLSKPLFSTKTLLNSLLSRTFFSSSASAAPPTAAFRPSFLRSRSAAGDLSSRRAGLAASSTRTFATRAASSSLNDQNPNWSNRPPKETILLDGCDFEHWLVVMEKPEGDPTRDEIIDSYIKTLAMVVGSEEDARMKIYSVSTRCYFAFGALVSEEVSHKIKELPRVRWVLPDSYLDVKNKDYGGEPFINGQAVPYDPKYHEEWERNNARAMERNRRNDRPRNNDRSRNFNRRRENMQNQDFQTRPPPMANPGMSNPVPNMSGHPPGSMGPSNPGGFRPSNAPHPGFNNPGMQQNIHGPGAPPPPNNYSMPQNNMGMQQPGNMGPPPSNVGWSNNMPGNMQQQNFQNGPNNGGVPPYQGAPQNYQNGPNSGGVPPYQGAPQNYQNGPNSGGVPPYQGAPQNYQNGYNPNRDGSGPSGYPYSG